MLRKSPKNGLALFQSSCLSCDIRGHCPLCRVLPRPTSGTSVVRPASCLHSTTVLLQYTYSWPAFPRGYYPALLRYSAWLGCVYLPSGEPAVLLIVALDEDNCNLWSENRKL